MIGYRGCFRYVKDPELFDVELQTLARVRERSPNVHLMIPFVRTLWELINAGSLAKLEPTIQSYAGGLLWDPVMVTILAAPSWGILGGLGIVFLLLGRKKKPLIGYARS